jgi:DNA-damage-inducible protein D
MSNIKLFESKHIRTVWNETDEKWYFVVEDVVLILTDSKDPKQYIKRMRQRDEELAKGWVQIVPTLWVETAGQIPSQWVKTGDR